VLGAVLSLSGPIEVHSSFQWIRTDEHKREEAIAGATKRQYSPEPRDVGLRLVCLVTLTPDADPDSTPGSVSTQIALRVPSRRRIEQLPALDDFLASTCLPGPRFDFSVTIAEVNAEPQEKSVVLTLSVFHNRLKIRQGGKTLCKSKLEAGVLVCGARGDRALSAQALFLFLPSLKSAYLIVLESAKMRNAAIRLIRERGHALGLSLLGPRDNPRMDFTRFSGGAASSPLRVSTTEDEDLSGSSLAIVGDFSLGHTVSVQNAAPGSTFQWSRFDAVSNSAKPGTSAAGEEIEGATRESYSPEPRDVGRTLRCRVTPPGGLAVSISSRVTIFDQQGLWGYVDAALTLSDVFEFSCAVLQKNFEAPHAGLDDGTHKLCVGAEQLKIRLRNKTRYKAAYSPAIQICGLRGGGARVPSVLFLSLSTTPMLHYALEMDDSLQRNAAILLVRRRCQAKGYSALGPGDSGALPAPPMDVHPASPAFRFLPQEESAESGAAGQAVEKTDEELEATALVIMDGLPENSRAARLLRQLVRQPTLERGESVRRMSLPPVEETAVAKAIEERSGG
jgi:hypothetical protein